jgi:hypothetical protein
VGVLLLAPVAAAGTEANPDISDVPNANIRDGALDFLSAWFEPHPTGLGITVKVREGTTLASGDGWAVGFDMGGVRHVMLLGVDDQGRLRSCACVMGGLRTPASAFPDDLQDVTFHAGKPATFTALVPYKAVPGLQPGAVLENVGAGSEQYSASRGWLDYDTSSAIDGYAVQRAFLPPAVSAALPFVVGGLALVAVGAGATVLVLRRRAQPPPPAAAPPSATLTPTEPPLPGRMILRPPR